jgi:hypothetical protein
VLILRRWDGLIAKSEILRGNLRRKYSMTEVLGLLHTSADTRGDWINLSGHGLGLDVVVLFVLGSTRV